MYFWRIEKLKAEMATRPLSDSEVLPYFALFLALSTAASYIPRVTLNLWDGLGAAWSVTLAVVGSIYVYRLNGGASGQHLLQRYIALGWVVTIRLLVVFVAAAVIFYGELAAAGTDAVGTQWYDFLFLGVIEAGFYWRIGHHVRDLAQKAAA